MKRLAISEILSELDLSKEYIKAVQPPQKRTRYRLAYNCLTMKQLGETEVCSPHAAREAVRHLCSAGDRKRAERLIAILELDGCVLPSKRTTLERSVWYEARKIYNRSGISRVVKRIASVLK